MRPARKFAVITIFFWCAFIARTLYYIGAFWFLGLTKGDLRFTGNLWIHEGVPSLFKCFGLAIPSCFCAFLIYRDEKPWAMLGIAAMTAIAFWHYFLSDVPTTCSLIHDAIIGRPMYIWPTLVFLILFHSHPMGQIRILETRSCFPYPIPRDYRASNGTIGKG